MLNEGHVLRCYEEGIGLYVSKKHIGEICVPSDCFQKGYFDGSEAVVILPHIESFDDLAVTVIHELIHARDDVLRYYSQRRAGLQHDFLERIVEEEASKTYSANPSILGFIGEIYQMDFSLFFPDKKAKQKRKVS